MRKQLEINGKTEDVFLSWNKTHTNKIGESVTRYIHELKINEKIYEINSRTEFGKNSILYFDNKEFSTLKELVKYITEKFGL